MRDRAESQDPGPEHTWQQEARPGRRSRRKIGSTTQEALGPSMKWTLVVTNTTATGASARLLHRDADKARGGTHIAGLTGNRMKP